MPTCTTAAGLKMFGTISDQPYADGLALAVFPGMASPIEVPGMVFTKPQLRKRPPGNLPTSKRANTSEGKGDEDASEEQDEEDGGEEGVREAAEEEEEEEVGNVLVEGGGHPQVQERTSDEESDKKDKGGKTKLRPLQLFLKTRPAGMKQDERHAIWKSMSPEQKTVDADTTNAERGRRAGHFT